MKKNVKQDEPQMNFSGSEEAELLERLNERVERAVTMIQKLRKERDDLRARLQDVERQISEQGASSEELASATEELERYREERGEVRGRIERILDSLETLEEDGD
ncbi:MAG TPA: cell division protein ZapB [Thermoanaerobaculia bacterium]|nr:cell division protein ZapB [Thermoanaerobaculia bacterium]